MGLVSPGAGPDMWRNIFQDHPRYQGFPMKYERRTLPAEAQCAWRDTTGGHETLGEQWEGCRRSSGEGNGTHSSALAWRIPGTGEPGGLPSTGSHRVRQTAVTQQQQLTKLQCAWRSLLGVSLKPSPASPQLCDPGHFLHFSGPQFMHL